MTEVEKLIPHRPPFLFVDEIVSHTGETLVAKRTWRAEEDFYKGHYPGAPITHGAVYVVFGPTGLQIKRLLFGEESSGDGEPVRRVCLWSDNAEHGRDWIPMETFYRDYRVVAAALKVERDL